MGAGRRPAPDRRRRHLHAHHRRARRPRCPGWRSPAAPSARCRSATAARSAATSPPRRRRATRCRRSTRPARSSSCLARAARGACRSREFVTGPKRTALAPDELITAFTLPPPPAAAVRQGRHAQRDGDRGLLGQPRAVAGARAAWRRASAPPGPTPLRGRRGRGVHRRRARRGRLWEPRALPDDALAALRRAGRRRRRGRSTTCAAPPPTAATRSACWRGAR